MTASTGAVMAVILDKGTPQVTRVAILAAASAYAVLTLSVRCWHGIGGYGQGGMRAEGRDGSHA